MTLLRPLLALTACLTLSACYLMAERPRFDDSQSVSILGSETTTFAHFDRGATEWKPSDMPLVTLIPVGNHYILHDPSGGEATEDDLVLHFVALDDSHWLMQLSPPATATDPSVYFGVATWDGAEILAHPIACDDLRDRPGIADLVSFVEDDCTLLPPATGTAPDFPPVLWQDLPPADKKLVLQPAG